MKRARSVHLLDGGSYVIRVRPGILRDRPPVKGVVKASNPGDCTVNACTNSLVFYTYRRKGMTYLEKDRGVFLLGVLAVSVVF
jgi:hypothetical protein